MAVTQLDDQELVKRLRVRDDAALEVLMAQYQTKVFGLALRLTRNRQDAEEVLQDVFWTVFRKIGTFRGSSKLSSWIYRIAANTALMKLRNRAPQIESWNSFDSRKPAMAPFTSPSNRPKAQQRAPR